jgi:hypothetical protein
LMLSLARSPNESGRRAAYSPPQGQPVPSSPPREGRP